MKIVMMMTMLVRMSKKIKIKMTSKMNSTMKKTIIARKNKNIRVILVFKINMINLMQEVVTIKEGRKIKYNNSLKD